MSQVPKYYYKFYEDCTHEGEISTTLFPMNENDTDFAEYEQAMQTVEGYMDDCEDCDFWICTKKRYSEEEANHLNEEDGDSCRYLPLYEKLEKPIDFKLILEALQGPRDYMSFHDLFYKGNIKEYLVK
jgi:hypothetical protein